MIILFTMESQFCVLITVGKRNGTRVVRFRNAVIPKDI